MEHKASGEVSIDSEDPKPASPRDDQRDEMNSWVEYYDDTYGLYYYVNTETGECHWGDPTVEAHDGSAVTTDYAATVEQDDFEALEKGDPHDSDAEGRIVIDLHNQAKSDVHEAEHIQSESPGSAQRQKKLDYAALWKEYYADTDDDQGEHYNPYEHERDLEEGLEYPPDDLEEYDGEEELAHDHTGEYEPYNEESAPKTVKNRSKDVLTGGTNQDYLHMARMYKLTRPYSDPAFLGMCVLCHANFADMVFFPCEHRCVCSECVDREHICSDSQMNSIRDGYCNCSLCAAVIKLILPSENGAEVEKYWSWVYEEPVKLPNNFLRNFRHSAAVIRTVFVRHPKQEHIVDSYENASKSCCVS